MISSDTELAEGARGTDGEVRSRYPGESSDSCGTLSPGGRSGNPPCGAKGEKSSAVCPVAAPELNPTAAAAAAAPCAPLPSRALNMLASEVEV